MYLTRRNEGKLGHMDHGNERRRGWLQEVYTHPFSEKRHQLAAEAMCREQQLPSEHVDAAEDLVKWRLAVRESGQYRAIDAKEREWAPSHPSWSTEK